MCLYLLFLVYRFERSRYLVYVSIYRGWYGRQWRDNEEENVGGSGGCIHHTCGTEPVKASWVLSEKKGYFQWEIITYILIFPFICGINSSFYYTILYSLLHFFLFLLKEKHTQIIWAIKIQSSTESFNLLNFFQFAF